MVIITDCTKDGMLDTNSLIVRMRKIAFCPTGKPALEDSSGNRWCNNLAMVNPRFLIGVHISHSQPMLTAAMLDCEGSLMPLRAISVKQERHGFSGDASFDL